MKVFKTDKFWLALIILVQTIVYLLVGGQKAYLHMDEIYSYGLANHETVQIYDTEGFYGEWHDAEYYERYLTVDKGESGDFSAVYENQKNDVHPPLFYGLLRIGMEMHPEFTKWTGIVLNIVIAGISTVVLWLVVKRLTDRGRKELKVKASSCDGGSVVGDKEGKELNIRALALTAVVALGMATVSTVIYIRMYELLTLWILLTTWLHLKLNEKDENWKLYVGIGVVEFLGALTQYYYWFFMVAMFAVMAVRYVRRKKWKELARYAAVVIGTGLVSLAVWPYALQHMLFSNRGGGVLEKLTNPGTLVENLWQYMGVVDRYAMHYLLMVAVIAMIVLGVGALTRGEKLMWSERRRRDLMVVFVPVIFYMLIVTAVSPFIELRYVAPVCGLFLVLIAVVAEQIVELRWGRKIGQRIMLGVLAVFMVMPVVTGVKPDTLYAERAEVVEWAREHSGTPALYLTKGGGDWVFLNDLLLFREFGESYVVKDLQGEDKAKVAELKKILEGKDLSEGLIVVVNDDYDKEEMVELIEKATGMSAEHAARVVTSDVYYMM